MKPLEWWAGPECTVNRVGHRFHEQMPSNGFTHRLDDLDRLAGLGITRMRFPILWETTCTAPGVYAWDWSDARIARLCQLGVAPIAGLLHHGSGPEWTNLLDPAFPRLLAEYARAVAMRYPGIDAWTPVNEPLTTARFSALYGLWYPHRTDDTSFVRALLHQVQGTVLAMRAVREVNAAAQLVQTDDLGLCTSSPRLAYQARFENHRRWLGFDLLMGRVDRRHRMWPYLRRYGATEEELETLREQPCAPDVIGINSYVTSERQLDERVWLYPPAIVGGNRRDRYADIEAVRASGAFIGGFEARLREAAQRYGRPVAATEVHLGCTREEQLRWLHQAWLGAGRVRDEGHDVRAVTCWAAFGCFDWNSLVTRQEGHYETGLWDVRSDPPRATALVNLVRALAQGETPAHPVLAGAGWWQRDDRLQVPPEGQFQSMAQAGRPVLITGGRGTLAQAFARACESRGLPWRLLARAELDIADGASVEAALQRWQPWAVVNAAGYVRVDDAESDARQWRENAEGPAVLAQACGRHGVRLATFSSDLVFDGGQVSGYLESALARPINAYGRAKAHAERTVAAANPEALIVRTAAFFGPLDHHNFVTLALDAMRRGERWRGAQDQVVSPTYVPDLVHATLDLLVDGECGIWHLANQGAVTWAELARLAAQAAGLDASLVQAVPAAALGQMAARPAYSALCSERGTLLPALSHALARYTIECGARAETTHAHLETVA